MIIQRLRLQSFRRFVEAELQPRPGFNLVTGDNGSGKTSLLEALHLLAHGRSFRGRARDGLIRQGEPALGVYAEWVPGGAEVVRRAGLRHAGAAWEARLDGGVVGHLGELCEALAVVSFEPGSHALVDGPAEGRRRYLDWGLFHVERSERGGDFLQLWRRHARALKQRNALLRGRHNPAQLEAWEHEVAQAGEALTRQRDTHVARLQPHLDAMVAALLPAAGGVAIELVPGWRRELSLADALLLARDRDTAHGHTSVGPHRADLRLELRDLPGRQSLSRGQAKLLALALLLAQARHLAEQDGHWPVLQLDDLASELDRTHQHRVVETLHASGAQVFVTGTEAPPVLRALELPITQFHVEHGSVRPLD